MRQVLGWVIGRGVGGELAGPTCVPCQSPSPAGAGSCRRGVCTSPREKLWLNRVPSRLHETISVCVLCCMLYAEHE